jgi:hypothetical protein
VVNEGAMAYATFQQTVETVDGKPSAISAVATKVAFGMQRESQRPCTSKLWTQEMPKHRSISAIDRQGRWCFEGRYDGGGDVPTSGDREQCRYTERGQICHDLNIAVAE